MNMMKGDRTALPLFVDHLVLAFACASLAFISFGSCETPPASSDQGIAAIVGGTVVSVVFVVVVGLAVFYCLCIVDKRTKKGHFAHIGSHASDVSSLPIDVRDHLKKMQFTYAEVLEITSTLRIKLGEGGFGPVYYGKLKDGSPVAVKRLSSTSHQGTQEFLNEVEIMSRCHHKNLVSLVGYCCEENERCLIYEFMPNGNLHDRLHGLPSEREPMEWLTRLKIAVGAAKGFNYLHNDCAPAIIHRDVKCSNILLDGNLAAKVADFGLSKLLSQPALTHITTGVKGTFGYLDPEYAQTQRLTEKSDVYSFGVILLELLTGNKPIMQDNGDYDHIAQWARPHITTRTFGNILDKKMGDITEKETVESVAKIALQCVASKSTERPYFQEILQALEAALKLELPQQAPLPSAADVSIDIQTVVLSDPNSRTESFT